VGLVPARQDSTHPTKHKPQHWRGGTGNPEERAESSKPTGRELTRRTPRSRRALNKRHPYNSCRRQRPPTHVLAVPIAGLYGVEISHRVEPEPLYNRSNS